MDWLAWLNSAIPLQTLIWMFLVTFMIHDFEEIIWVESWVKKNYDKVHAAVPKSFKRDVETFRGMRSDRFAVAVFLEFLIFIPVTWLAAHHDQYLFFFGFNLILLLHVFTHLGQSLYLRMYTPGVVTAVLVTLPFSVYLFYRFFDAGLVDWLSLLISLPAGALLLPIVLGGHKLAKMVFPDELIAE